MSSSTWPDNAVSINTTTGMSFQLGPFGELLVGSKRQDVAVMWPYDLLNTSDDLRTPVVTGDGAVAVVGHKLQVSSAVTGTAYVESRKSIHYVPGHTGYIDFTASFTGTGIGRIGGVDDQDGFYIKYDNGVMYFGYNQDGSYVEESFTGAGIQDPAGNQYDPTKVTIYRILFGFLGVASPVLMVKMGDYQVAKVLRTEGTMTDVHVHNPAFPISAYAENGCNVLTASWSGGTFGDGEDPVGRSFHFPNIVMTSGAGASQASMVLSGTNVGTAAIFHNKTLTNSKKNKVRARLLIYGFYVDPPSSTAAGSVAFQIVANPTLSGTPDYTDIETDISVMEYDHTAATGASVNYSSGGRVIICGNIYYQTSSGNRGSTSTTVEVDAERLGAIAEPDDVFSILFKDRGGNNVTVRWFFDWEELW